MLDFLKKLLSGSNEAELKKIQKTVDKINALEPEMQKLTDDGMRAKLQELRGRAQSGTSLDDLLPETYALSREAAVRVLAQPQPRASGTPLAQDSAPQPSPRDTPAPGAAGTGCRLLRP